MSKSGHYPGNRQKGNLPPHTPSSDSVNRPGDKSARRESSEGQWLIKRLLDTPHLEQVVPRLQPGLLHRAIRACGLEGCGEILALATPDQLARVFDLDLWRAARPGMNEQFDGRREAGAVVAARKLAGIGADRVAAGLAEHVLVYDLATRSPTPGAKWTGWTICCWRESRPCSTSRPTANNAAKGRGTSRPLMPARFLQAARELRPESSPISPASPFARAYFRSLDASPSVDAPNVPNTIGLLAAVSEAPSAEDDVSRAEAAVYGVLLDAEVFRQPTRALLGGAEGQSSRLSRIHDRLEYLLARDESAYAARSGELAYLANTLMAGCSLQGRPFTAEEASEAALAACNLGLENWSLRWLSAGTTEPPVSFLADHDLICVFQVGWAGLHRDVCLYTVGQLLRILSRVRCADREIQMGLDVLRSELAKHRRAAAPWRARLALEVIALLDLPEWAALLALIDECPALHAAVAASRDLRVLSVKAADFEFIAENRQTASVREFLQSLPATLSR